MKIFLEFDLFSVMYVTSLLTVVKLSITSFVLGT